ncbi:hypothetical protein [Aeromicrobium alkaliterrae]|uniref:Uncharacterized protein n=1 Tax=Aeromicrobium alkaliterrae TaxID=302168 RepID=A0ABP4VYA4_9ACTN
MTTSQQAATATLTDLAHERGAEVSVDGPRVTLRIADGAAATGLTGAVAVRAEIVVTLGGGGRYVVTVRQGDASGGVTPGGLTGSASWSSHSGTVSSRRIEKGVGPGGAYDLGFDTRPWTEEIQRRLAPLGYAPASVGAVVGAILWLVLGGLLLGGALALGIVGGILGSPLLLGLLAVPLVLGLAALALGFLALRRR